MSAVNPKAVALIQKIKTSLNQGKAGVPKVVTGLGVLTAKRNHIHAELPKLIAKVSGKK